MKSVPGTGRVRCAIYTRVSTDQGLDQDFNSLDAQYEAASAYMLGPAARAALDRGRPLEAGRASSGRSSSHQSACS
jgi:hypothetical protein